MIDKECPNLLNKDHPDVFVFAGSLAVGIVEEATAPDTVQKAEQSEPGACQCDSPSSLADRVSNDQICSQIQTAVWQAHSGLRGCAQVGSSTPCAALHWEQHGTQEVIAQQLRSENELDMAFAATTHTTHALLTTWTSTFSMHNDACAMMEPSTLVHALQTVATEAERDAVCFKDTQAVLGHAMAEVSRNTAKRVRSCTSLHTADQDAERHWQSALRINQFRAPIACRPARGREVAAWTLRYLGRW